MNTPQQFVTSADSQTSATGCPATSNNKSTAIKELQDFANTNYEDGGHWVYEAFDAADYQEVLDGHNGNVEQAKAQLREYWQRMCMLEKEYAFGDGKY